MAENKEAVGWQREELLLQESRQHPTSCPEFLHQVQTHFSRLLLHSFLPFLAELVVFSLRSFQYNPVIEKGESKPQDSLPKDLMFSVKDYHLLTTGRKTFQLFGLQMEIYGQEKSEIESGH